VHRLPRFDESARTFEAARRTGHLTIETPGERPTLVSVQYLRGLAACGVLAFHAIDVAGGRFEIGAYGVNLFFVISGFIMVWITHDGSRPLPFLRDRIRRIVPLYWLATACLIFLIRLLDGSFRYNFKELLSSFLFIPNGEPGEGRHYFPALNVGWTLNYEAMFYALLAMSLLLPSRWRLCATSAALIGLVAAGQLLRPSIAPWEFWTHSIILHFLAGAWLAAVFKPRGAAIFRGAALVIVVTIVALVPPIAPAVLLMTGVLILDLAGLVPRTRLLLLGDASYSIYLFHTMGIMICAGVARKIAVSGPTLAVAAFATGLAVGLAAYWLLERPIQHVLLRSTRVSGSG
jgi:exopolysaccharide production protein ExoZ